MEIQRSLLKRKRHERIDEKIADKMSISGRIFHQIAVKTFFGFHVNLEQAFHQIPNASGHDYESVSPCNSSQFSAACIQY